MVDLCRHSGNDWYRVYLIRKISSQRGVEFVQKLLNVADVRWLFPDEVLQQVMLPFHRMFFRRLMKANICVKLEIIQYHPVVV